MNENRNSRRWTIQEEDRLLRQIRLRPQNLHSCFMIVSDVIGRTPSAVANHWYTVLSKKPEALCFFTASPKHVSKNRKNGQGIQSTVSIWRRLISIIHNF